MQAQVTLSSEFTRRKLERDIAMLKAKSDSLGERLKTGKTLINGLWKELNDDPANSEKLAEVERNEDYWLLLWRKNRAINLRIKALSKSLSDCNSVK